MKLNNLENIGGNLKNNENLSKNYNPDSFLDKSTKEKTDKFEDSIKISEKIKYNPDKMIDTMDIGNGKLNKELGCKRENEVYNDLQKQYPEKDKYKILQERTLKNRYGESVKDADGSKRRIDFVVVKDKEVVDSIEVTSLTADKREQLKKEYDIRNDGGNYVKDPNTGELYKIPDNVNTRIERRE